MVDDMNAAQTKLFDKLPETFVREEDFRTSNSPGTVIRDMSGREAYRFTRGDARAFGSLERLGKVVRIESRSEGELIRVVFMKEI